MKLKPLYDKVNNRTHGMVRETTYNIFTPDNHALMRYIWENVQQENFVLIGDVKADTKGAMYIGYTAWTKW